MTRITAAVCTEFGAPLEMMDLTLRAPQAGEIEVTLDAVAICHSDILFAKGAWGGMLPAVFGHEAAGRVTGLGDGVRGLSIGDKVVVTLIRACGHCLSCATGQPTICETPRDGLGVLSLSDGRDVVQSMATGGFAEKVVVHQSQVVALPDAIPSDLACLLACGVITGVGAAVHSGDLRAGEDVVVIGAGGVGLNAIQGAALAGARRIVAVDLNEQKLEDARAFGATDTVLASTAKPWNAATQALGRKADLVLVSVGAIPAYEDAMRYIGNGGRMVMVGMPHTGAKASYEPVMVAATGQRMIGSKMGDAVIARDIPWLADLFLQGRLKLEELVSRRWSFDQINEAIADTKAGNARRNVIVFGDGHEDG